MVAHESWGLVARFESDIFHHKKIKNTLDKIKKTYDIIQTLQTKQYKINKEKLL